MTILWSETAAMAALAGGALIGLAATLLWLFNGRIAGISGILAGVLVQRGAERQWRLIFVAGLLVAPSLFALVAPLPAITMKASPLVLLVAGVLVGLGTRYASGCTSGHGICGLSRGALRSLVATVCFVGSGMVTVFVVRHLVG